MIKATFDIEELERLKDGDHPTFAVLVEQFTPLLHTCCRQQGIREQDLDDVVNDIWLKVYQGLPGYRGEAALSTWLWRVAVHTSVSFIRKQKKPLHIHGAISSPWHTRSLGTDSGPRGS